MKRWVALSLALGMVACAESIGAAPAFAAEQAAEPGYDAASFATALAKFEAGDPSVDAGALRQQNLLRLHNTIPDWDSARDAFAALKTDPAKALASADAHRKNDPLSLDALFVAENALTGLGRADEAKLRHEQILALLRSATHGTDGQSRDKAWTAISVHEEYSILGILGFQPSKQSLMQDGGHAFDVLEATPPDGSKPVSIWFNIDAFFGKELGYLAQ